MVPQPALEESHLHERPATQQTELNGAAPEIRPSIGRFPKWKWSWVVLAGLAVLLTWTARYYFGSSDVRAFDRFWSPVLSESNPVLIYIGSNAVYQLSPAYMNEYYKLHPRSRNEAMGFESYIPLPPGTKLDVQDLYPAKDTFVTIGDVAATTKIATMLARRNRQFDIRFGGDVAYGDLRQSPTILIGAHNNPWTLTMTENLRYVFDGPMAIVDRTNTQRRWSAKEGFPEDYAIVSRVLNSETGTAVITAAGIGYAGTRAAAEFMTDPHSIQALDRSLPKGWGKKNLQIVLHTKVINQVPTAPDVVTTYCW
jgi:hypothetical protein